MESVPLKSVVIIPTNCEVYSIQPYVIKFVTVLWFSLGTQVSSTNKTDHHKNVIETFLKL